MNAVSSLESWINSLFYQVVFYNNFKFEIILFKKRKALWNERHTPYYSRPFSLCFPILPPRRLPRLHHPLLLPLLNPSLLAHPNPGAPLILTPAVVRNTRVTKLHYIRWGVHIFFITMYSRNRKVEITFESRLLEIVTKVVPEIYKLLKHNKVKDSESMIID